MCVLHSQCNLSHSNTRGRWTFSDETSSSLEKDGRRMRSGATACFIVYKVSFERIYMYLVSSLSRGEVKKRHFICHLGVLKLIFQNIV